MRAIIFLIGILGCLSLTNCQKPDPEWDLFHGKTADSLCLPGKLFMVNTDKETPLFSPEEIYRSYHHCYNLEE